MNLIWRAQDDCPLTPINDQERLRVLAKVYELLLKLEEKVEALEGAVIPVTGTQVQEDTYEMTEEVPTADLVTPETP